jgi:hypothetical protein
MQRSKEGRGLAESENEPLRILPYRNGLGFSKQSQLKRIIMIAWFLLSPWAIFSVNPPKEPELPTLAKEDPKEARGESRDLRKWNLELILCDGRIVSGTWESVFKDIQFTHTKDGIQYKKSISMRNIDKIIIMTWRPENEKETSKGKQVQFNPSEIKIRDDAGGEFYRETSKDMDYLWKIEIQNVNGNATLYAYWVDLMTKDGKWFTGLPKSKEGIAERKDCYKDVIKEIKFKN